MKKILKNFKSSPHSSIKWDNYFEIYENCLNRFINKNITLVEIGIGNGGSLFMWRNFLGKKAKIIGIELNPEAKKFEKYGFKIFIGDQSDPAFWKDFYNKNGKIDILIDDGGHTNLQQITTLMESVENMNNGGVILIEDTHTSFMNYKGFKNPSKNSLINFTTNIIENLHRRNPMVKKRMNDLSKKIYSIEYFDSIVLFNINKKKLSYSKNLHNNKKLNPHFIDYRFKRPNAIKEYSQENFVTGFFKSKISKKGLINRVYENNIIKKYLKKIKK
ncbi:hypothetical protein IDG99_01620 [Pelagibacterales bacterium SAG-MED09]|nr:hypothetical protein [Pelagibacterales bacterium SAG-MED09]